MKYKMTRYANDTANGAYSYEEIVELEPVNEPMVDRDRIKEIIASVALGYLSDSQEDKITNAIMSALGGE